MMNKRKRPHYYGKLNVVNLDSEVYRIWLSRDAELDPSPSAKWTHDYETDPELWIRQDLAHKLIQITPLKDREATAVALLIQNCTLNDICDEIGVTRERARQILNKAFRRFREHARLLTKSPH